MEVPAGAVETETGFIWIADGICFFKNKGVASTAGTMARGLDRQREVFGDVRRPMLIDATLLPDAEYGSWIHFVKRLPTVATACAIVSGEATNLPGLGVYPDQIDRLVVPFRIFDEADFDDAIAFLAEHLESDDR